MTHIRYIAALPDGQQIPAETVLEIAGIPKATRAAELKKFGQHSISRTKALLYIAKNSQQAVLDLANAYYQICQQDQRHSRTIDVLLNRIADLEDKE